MQVIHDKNFEYLIDVLSEKGQSSLVAHIGISLDNIKHNGEKLESLLLWASRNYLETQINIYDDVQAYNLLIDKSISDDEALSESRKAGDDWINDNSVTLKKFKEIRILRYSDLAKQYLIENRISQIHKLYSTNAIFKSLVDGDVLSYVTRVIKRNPFIPSEKIERVKKFSTLYILDELATMSLLNENEDFVEIYAGRFLNILKDPRRHEVENLPEGLKNYPMIEVDFVRQPKKAPQNQVA